MEVHRVAVIGGGLMGVGIAEVAARASCDVVLVESTEEAAKSAMSRLGHSLRRAEDRGKIVSAASVLERIRFSATLDDVADRQMVIEAIVEDEMAKTTLFRQLDEIVRDPEAVLASNTSSIPIMKLGAATARPQQVIGIHFFNPVPVLTLVELVPSLMTSSDTLEVARSWIEGPLGKRSIKCKDRAGFVVNALLVPFILSGIRMLESGFASAEDIDEGLVRGAAHPQGR